MTVPWARPFRASALSVLTMLAAVLSALLAAPATAATTAVATAVATPAGGSGPAHIVPGPARPDAVAGSEGAGFRSTNWSGYVVLHQKVQFVHARWVVPLTTCAANDPNFQDTSFWVGIDGWSDGTVEQAGTDVRCLPGSTQPSYVAWWEMYPTNAEQFVFTVHPGDRMDASVKLTAGTYVLKVTDLTTGQSFSRSKKCGAGVTCQNTSAEWVAESPSYSSGLADLANFKTWKPTQMTMTVAGGPVATGPATYVYHPVTMVTSDASARTRAKVSADLQTTAKNTFVDTFVYAGVT